MRYRRAALALGGAALLGGLVLYATQTSLRARLPAAARAADRIAALWTPTAPGAGGYRHDSLDPQFDLLETAWRLRLHVTYGIEVPATISREALAASLADVVQAPESISHLPPLEVLRLAVVALDDLGRPAQLEGVAGYLDLLQTDVGYSFEPGGSTDDSALGAVATIVNELQLPTSPLLRDRVRAIIATTSRGGSIQDAADMTMPAWSAANLLFSRAERDPFLDGLAGQLDSLWRVFASVSDWDGPTLALYVTATEVAHANGLPAPELGADAWGPLELPNGYLGVARGSREVDAQTTYLAARAGRPPPPLLLSTIVRTATPLGWAHESEADPEATALAAFVLRRLGVDAHEQDVRRQSELWLEGLRQVITDEAVLRSLIRDVAAVNFAATVVSGETWAPAMLSGPLDVDTWTEGERRALVRALMFTGAVPDPSVAAALVAAHEEVPTSRDGALAQALVGELLGRDDLEFRAAQFMTGLRSGDVYLARPGHVLTDLRSTAIGYAFGNATSIEAASRFAAPLGFVLSPGIETSGSVGALELAFLAVGLASGFDSLAQIP